MTEHTAVGRVRAWLKHPDRAVPLGDIRELVADHADDFTWEQWAVCITFPRGVTMVDHDTEDEARSHLRQLLSMPIEDRRVEVVRRVSIQGTWRPAPGDEDGD